MTQECQPTFMQREFQRDKVDDPGRLIQSLPPETVRKGWICPKCGNGVSPSVDVCPCSTLVKNVFVQNGSR